MNYLDELNLLMKKIKFIPDKRLRSNPRGGYFVILGKFHNSYVVLRTAPISDSIKVIRFKREHEVSKILAYHNKNSKSNIINFVEVLAVQESSNLCWSIRVYSKEKTLAIDENYHHAVLHGYDAIRQKFVGNHRLIIKNIIDTVETIQKIDSNIINNVSDKKLFSARLDQDLKNIDISKIESLLNINISASLKFYNQNSKEYFNKKNIKANMGDLIPSNIIVDQRNRVILYDYEWFCYDNYMLDYSTLWMFLWRYPKWQETIIKGVLTSEKDKVFFRLSLIRELISWYAGAFSVEDKEVLQKRLDFYKKHIWLRYLNAAGSSFNLIIKVRN